MEYFSVYTPFGEKTDEKVSRKEAHDKGICHRVVHLWILNAQNEVLVQQRSLQKDTRPGFWYVSVGGHIEHGEKVEQAILRETREELGIDIALELDRIRYLYSFHEEMAVDGVIDNEFYDVFALKLDIPLDQITMQESEVQAVKYMGYDEFKSAVLSPNGPFVAHDIAYKLLAIALDRYLQGD